MTAIEFETFAIELREPLETAAGRIERRRGIAVRVTDGGTMGVGEATPLPGWTESESTCQTALTGVTPPVTRNSLKDLVDRPAARFGLETALADRRARHRDQALYRSLGADTHVSSIPVHRTIGAGTVEATVNAVSAAIEAGFEAVKLKVGDRPLDRDLEMLEAVRAAAGPDLRIRVDANGAWDRHTAARFLGSAVASDLDLVEQPLPVDDDGGLATLPDSAPIAVDETLLQRHRAGLDPVPDGADVAVIKPMALGGIDRAMAIATRASQSSVRCVVTTTIDAVIARTAAVHLAARIAPDEHHGLATAGLLASDIGPDPAPVRSGDIVVPNGKGLGTDGPWEEKR